MKEIKRFLQRKKVIFVILISLVMVAASAHILQGESDKKGYLGVSVERLSRHEKKELGISHGIIVTQVVKGEAAEEAGIEEDDIIQYFNEEKILTPDDLVDAVRDAKPKTKVIIKLARDGKPKEVTAILGKVKSRWSFFDHKGGKGLIFISGGAYLGVHLQELNNDLAAYFGVNEDEGVLVLNVEKDSPAEESGIKSGDVIIQIDDEKVSGPGDVTEIISDLEEGDKIDIQLIRHKKKKKVNAELDKKSGLKDLKFLRDFKDGFQMRSPRIRMSIPHVNIPHISVPHIGDDHIGILEIKVPELDETKTLIWHNKLIENIEGKLKKVKKKIPKKIRFINDHTTI